MKITNVETTILRVPTGDAFGDARASVTARYWVVVELETDTNEIGTGWLGTWKVPELYRKYIESELTNVLEGQDPQAIEDLHEKMREQALYYPGETGLSANARGAVDVALWDLAAKAADVPLYKLLGGEDAAVRAYCSRLDADHDQTDLHELFREYADRGFTAFKTKVGGNEPTIDDTRVQKVREAIGDEADLFVDANQTWTVDEAARVVETLSVHDIGWVEEPISEWEFRGHRRLNNQMNPPLASGEMFYRPERFELLLKDDGLDVAQPDLLRIGGVSGLLDVAKIAAEYDVPVAPHINYAVSAHVVAAVSNGWLVEYVPEYDASDILVNAPTINNGHIHLSAEPGHGYQLDAQALERFAYEK